MRLEWHRFLVNVGKPGRKFGHHAGRSRHPPSVELNLPHLEFPSRGIRHWPWKQHAPLLLRRYTRQAAFPERRIGSWS